MRHTILGLSKVLALTALAGAAIALAPASGALAGKFKVVHSFCTEKNCREGAHPIGPLRMDPNGDLFGVADEGGKYGNGALYELARQPDGRLKSGKIFDFEFVQPEGGVVIDTQGNFYGELTEGQFYKVSFGFGKNHDKWGITFLQVSCPQQDCGERRFGGLTYRGAATGAPWDGASPLYGTTSTGGANGGGTVFQLDLSGDQGTETVLYSFCSQGGDQCTDGKTPAGGLIFDGAGNLYGTALEGGNPFDTAGAGLVYELTPNGSEWNEVTLYRFCSAAKCADGEHPIGALAIDAAGNLFGATVNGAHCRGFRDPICGVIFELVPSGEQSQETVLYSFCRRSDCRDGRAPQAGPTVDSQGLLHGTTEVGGGNDIDQWGQGGGVVYELSAGSYRVIHRFCSRANCADGEYPNTELVTDSTGNYFGTTYSGGKTGSGTLFTASQ